MPTAARLEKWLTPLALALIMAWPLGLVDLGFDHTDSGYYLAFYRDGLNFPDHNVLTQVLTNWLGALVYAALPDSGQFLAFRLICVGLYAFIVWFSFLILREHFPLWLCLLALALASIQSTAHIYIFSYNTLTYLFLAAAILLMYRGLARDRPLLLYLAALLLGLNVFVRLPNILQWGLATVPFWYYWFCLGRRGRAVGLTLRFTLTLLVTFISFLGLVGLVLGPQWLGREVDALADLLIAFGRPYNHSASNFLDSYDLVVRDCLSLLAWAATRLLPLSLALGAGLALWGRRRWAASALAALGLTVGLIAGLTGLSWLPEGGFPALALKDGQIYVMHYQYIQVQYFPLELFCTFLTWGGPAVALLGLLWYHQRRPLLSALCGMIIVIFLVMPYGTDYFITHYLYYTHLSVAGVLGLVYRLWLDGAAWLEDRWPGRIKLRETGAALAAVNACFWFILALNLNALQANQYFTHHGAPPYALTTAPVPEVKVLAGMKTSPGRAQWLADLKRLMEPYREERPMVVMGHCPLCVLVSEAESLFPYPWVDLHSHPREEFRKTLGEAAQAGRLPVVLWVNRKFNPWMIQWDNQPKEAILNRFLQEQNYTLRAENPAFRLYLPPGLGAEGQVEGGKNAAAEERPLPGHAQAMPE